MIYVVFVEPESPGNIGFLARVMKNFGFSDLILISPCEIGKKTYYHAMHAKDIIWNSKIYDSLEEFIEDAEIDFTVGTTGIAGGSYNIPRIAVTPKRFAESLKVTGKIALLFGREGNGLSNHEISMCDVVVTVPTHESYPIMNISHAAAIVFYELFKKEQNRVGEGFEEASSSEKTALIKDMNDIIAQLGYPLHKRKIASLIFKRIIGRAFISARESHTLRGTLRRIKGKMENGGK